MHSTCANVTTVSHNYVWLVQLRMLCCHMTVTKHQETAATLTATIDGGGGVSDLLWPLLLPSAGTVAVHNISRAAHTHPAPPA